MRWSEALAAAKALPCAAAVLLAALVASVGPANAVCSNHVSFTHGSGNPNPAAQNQTVTITGQVRGPSGCATPSGTVTFTDNLTNIVLGTANLADTGSNQTSQGSITATFATVGDHDIKIQYNGDGNYNADQDSYTQHVTASSGGGGGSTDSQNVQTLQNTVTKSVAAVSGQVISGAIDGGISGGFSDGGTSVAPGPGGFTANFAGEPQDPKAQDKKRVYDDAFSALGYAGNYTKAPPRVMREWNAWMSVQGTGWQINDPAGTQKGSQINVTAGLGRKLTPDTLVGVVFGYENFKYDVPALVGNLTGNGETIGGYLAQRFGQLEFDAALAWSNMSYNATAGTATGSFNGSRWLFTTGLTGHQKFSDFTIEPSAKLFVLWENQTAWTDSLGTAQAANNFSSGRTALGAKVARSFVMGRGMLTPYAGLYGDWRFSSDNAQPAGAPVVGIGKGWAARVTSGATYTCTNGVALALGGELGGLGANYTIWSGTARVAVPF